jgi:hypothetical protein
MSWQAMRWPYKYKIGAAAVTLTLKTQGILFL